MKIEVVDVDVAGKQTWQSQEVTTHKLHLQTSWDEAVKADYLQLADQVVALHHLHSKVQHAMRPPCTRTLSRDMRIGMYFFVWF